MNASAPTSGSSVVVTTGSTSAFAPHLRPYGHACELTGVSLVAMPPTRFDIRIVSTSSMINVMPDAGATLHAARLNGAPHRFDGSLLDRVAVLGGGYELELACTTTEWELFVEFDERRAGVLAAEALDGAAVELPAVDEYRDRVDGTLARLAIEHLRSDHVEPLYLDGLAIAILARRIRRSLGAGREAALGGTDRRIRRAIEYAEAHLDERLSIAELASVATMSPTWFSASFRASTGRAVHAYVTHRRLERARELLREDARTIADVALACGFASQAHLTTRFGQAYGITPARWRRDAPR